MQAQGMVTGSEEQRRVSLFFSSQVIYSFLLKCLRKKTQWRKTRRISQLFCPPLDPAVTYVLLISFLNTYLSLNHLKGAANQLPRSVGNSEHGGPSKRMVCT